MFRYVPALDRGIVNFFGRAFWTGMACFEICC